MANQMEAIPWGWWKGWNRFTDRSTEWDILVMNGWVKRNGKDRLTIVGIYLWAILKTKEMKRTLDDRTCSKRTDSKKQTKSGTAQMNDRTKFSNSGLKDAFIPDLIYALRHPAPNNQMPSNTLKFTLMSYRTSALWGRCPALTPLFELITLSRASGTADHVRSLDDWLFYFHLVSWSVRNRVHF